MPSIVVNDLYRRWGIGNVAVAMMVVVLVRFNGTTTRLFHSGHGGDSCYMMTVPSEWRGGYLFGVVSLVDGDDGTARIVGIADGSLRTKATRFDMTYL